MYLRGGGTQMTIRVRASTSTMSSPMKSSPNVCSISEQISFPMSNTLDPKPAFLPVSNKFAGEENADAMCSGRPPKLGLLARDILARATGLETVP
ncbi:hypothetical protein WN943_017095 [Citrus x changshan-huyou]